MNRPNDSRKDRLAERLKYAMALATALLWGGWLVWALWQLTLGRW